MGTEELDEVFIVLKDTHSFLDKNHSDNQKIVAMLKKISHLILTDEDSAGTIVIVSPVLNIPYELEKFITVFEMDLPSLEEIEETIKDFAKAYDEEIEDEAVFLLASALKGLSDNEIGMLLNLTMQKNGELSFEVSKELILEEK